ncbi:hypothetical protein GCM10027053_18280 [Intrasporangium mesophilum]
MAWVYEVHVLGLVTDEALLQLRSDFDGVTATTEPANTVLTGSVPDQAALVGLLERLHALGIEVRELRRAVDESAELAAGS